MTFIENFYLRLNPIFLILITPLAGAMGVYLFKKIKFLSEALVIITSTILFYLVTNIFLSLNAGTNFEFYIIEVFPSIGISFKVEPLGIIFALLASFLWIVNTIYSIGYMRANSETNQTRFYICFCIAIFSAIAVAFSANLLTFFLFYEILTLSTYPLVTHAGSSNSRLAGRVYLIFLLGTSVSFLLLAIIYFWQLTGTLEFIQGGSLPDSIQTSELVILLFLFVFGIGKAAIMPFHFWLPAAMVAPTPVSALLHAVAVVKAGVFGIIKIIIYIFGVETLKLDDAGELLPYVASFTIITASLVALNSDNLKKRLAYSTVSQLSYIVLSISLLNSYAVIAAIFHLVAHAFGKITLFFAAGAIYTSSHKTEVSELNGIGRIMPATMIAFTIGAVTMIGLPLTGGFVSKWFLLSSSTIQEHWAILLVIIISTLLNVAYFMPIIYKAFFLKPLNNTLSRSFKEKTTYEHVRYSFGLETPILILLSMFITSFGSVLLFFYPEVIINLASKISE